MAWHPDLVKVVRAVEGAPATVSPGCGARMDREAAWWRDWLDHYDVTVTNPEVARALVAVATLARNRAIEGGGSEDVVMWLGAMVMVPLVEAIGDHLPVEAQA